MSFPPQGSGGTGIEGRSLRALLYCGAFDASQNEYPTDCNPGDYFIVTVGGTLNSIVYTIGDWIIYNGTSWDKIDAVDAVLSVDNLTGAVSLSSRYLGLTAKAADSDKLDGNEGSYYSPTTHDHNSTYLGINAKAADSDKLDGNESTAFIQHSLATDISQFLVSSSAGSFVMKTLVEVKTLLGLGTAAFKNIPATGNASATEIVYGSDTRLTDSRTPASHTHTDLTGTSAETFSASTLTSTKANHEGAPFVVTSQDVVTNLNADMVDGIHASAFADATHNHNSLYVGVLGTAANSTKWGGESLPSLTNGGARVLARNVDNTAFVLAQIGEVWASFTEGISDETAPADDDKIVMYDASASAFKEITRGNFHTRKETIVLTPGGAMLPTTTPATYGAGTDSTTNKYCLPFLEFSTSAITYAQWPIVMPARWNGGTLTAIFRWRPTGSGSNTGVTWAIQGTRYANDVALDSSWGTAVTVNDDVLAVGDLHETAETAEITLGNSTGRAVWIRVYRAYDNAYDTFTANAYLMSVELKFTCNATGD